MNYEKKLNELLSILRKLAGAIHHPFQDDDNVPTHNDPEKYARSAKIADEDAVALIWATESKQKAARTAHGEYDLAMAEAKAAQKRMFVRLSKLYPDVGDPLGSTVGWRKYKGSYYFVGWDDEEDASEEPNETTS